MSYTIIHRANTLESVKKARKKEIDGIEIDVRMTKDRVLVVHHDRSIEDGNGRRLWIDKLTYDEIKTISKPLVRLEQIVYEIKKIAQNKKKFIFDIDIKQAHLHTALYALLKRHRMFSSVSEIIISSPDIWILRSFDNLDRRFKLGLSLGLSDNLDLYSMRWVRIITVLLQYTLQPIIFRMIRKKARKKGIHYANIYCRLIDKNTLSFCREQGLKICIFGMKNKKEISRIKSYGADIIKIKPTFIS